MTATAVILLLLSISGCAYSESYEKRREEIHAEVPNYEQTYMVDATIVVPSAFAEKYELKSKESLKEELKAAVIAKAQEVKAQIEKGERTKRDDGYVDYEATLSLYEQALHFLDEHQVSIKF